MKHAVAWLMALALSTSLTTQTLAQESDTMSQDQNVLDRISTMTTDFQNKEIEKVFQSYEAQATIVFEPGAPVSNRDAQVEIFTGMAAINPVFVYSGHEVIVNGDTALHIAPWSMTATTPDGQEISQSGLSVAVLKKQSDGEWLMVIDNPHGQRLMAGN